MSTCEVNRSKYERLGRVREGREDGGWSERKKAREHDGKSPDLLC